MVYAILADVFGLIYSVFGHGLVVSLFVLGFFILGIVLMRGNIAAILILIIPVILGFLINTRATNFVELPPWILYAVLIIAGFISAFYIFNQVVR